IWLFHHVIQYLRYEGLQYTDADIADFEMRLARIYRREVHRVHVFNFGGLPDLMVEGLSARMLIEHKDAQGIVGFGAYWAKSTRQIPDKEDLRDYWIGISSAGDFLGTAPSYTAIRDLILRLCHRLIACSISRRSQAPEKVTMTGLFYLRGIDVGSVNVYYLLARYLRLFAVGRKSEALIFGGQFLVRLQICMEIDDTWAWVALGPKRQPDTTDGALEAAEDAPVVDEVDQAVLAPVQAPQQPPPPPPIAGLVERSMTDQGRFSTWMISFMTQLMKASGQTYQAFNRTFRGSSLTAFQRRARQRINGASTSTAQQDQQQPDP
ncbi:hypothetical protein Tco_1474938, partial [Tanacetum coccineum]